MKLFQHPTTLAFNLLANAQRQRAVGFFILFLMGILSSAGATTYGDTYPYRQKSEDGHVKVHAKPFTPRSGQFCLGETTVHRNGIRLYTIDHYWDGPLLTAKHGEYLIELDMEFATPHYNRILNEDGSTQPQPIVYDGDAIQIYRKGKKYKTIAFRDLGIDNAALRSSEGNNWWGWNFEVEDTLADPWLQKLSKHSAYVVGDSLYLITADDQLLAVDIETGKIQRKPHAQQMLKAKADWSPEDLDRVYYHPGYPDNLPKLANGKSLEAALAARYQKIITDVMDEDITLHIFVSSLLINSKGKCEDAYIVPSFPEQRGALFQDIVESATRAELEEWIKEQKFSTATLPKGFRKFSYHDLVYLK